MTSRVTEQNPTLLSGDAPAKTDMRVTQEVRANKVMEKLGHKKTHEEHEHQQQGNPYDINDLESDEEYIDHEG